MRMTWARFLGVGLAFGVFVAAGCQGTAVNRERQTTQLDSQDLVAMTNKMAASITGDGRVRAALAAGPLRIVIKPVRNLTNDVIPDEETELFVARLQGLLAREPTLAGRFVWCINRGDYEKLRKQELPAEKLGPTEDRVLPEYALYADFLAATRVTRTTRSDTYLCAYKLTRISGEGTGVILWEDQYETSKAVTKGFLD
jgi:hypothetical protein